MFARADLLAAALGAAPGRVSIADAEREVAGLETTGALHAGDLLGNECGGSASPSKPPEAPVRERGKGMDLGL